MTIDRPGHAVAIFGGACSGSVAAEILAERGVHVVVFEQNPRPYGKIEDGLPRWHTQQRLMEYRKIDQRLNRAGVHFVPNTKLGRDVDFLDVVGWGWSAVLLANGAWKDRPLEIPDADSMIGRGLVYQNPFVYWFNHANERDYTGPRYEIPGGAVCIGGGLASIDVIKIFQLELYAQALRARGIEASMYELEHAGIPKFCQTHGIADPASLGVVDSVLVYRRRVEDMPLASPPDGASPEQVKKTEVVRQKILAKAQERYRFVMRPLAMPKEFIIENGRVAGIVLLETELTERGAAPKPGSEFTLNTSLVVSSIGSIPEPLPGIAMKGTYYHYADWNTGAYAPIPGVFGLGNVVTGKGNIVASLNHGKHVANHLVEAYLGVGEDSERDVSSGFFEHGVAAGTQTATAALAHLERVAPLPVANIEKLLTRVAERQREIGYLGDYQAWLAQVTPPDLE